MIFQYSQFDLAFFALLATLFTYGVTMAGATLVFFFKSINRKVLDIMLGFAAGVMIAASFWSLLNPSIELAASLGIIPWVPAFIGFLLGAAFLFTLDAVIPHMHANNKQVEGIKTKMNPTLLLVLAITIHNIPEGLAVGIAFGAINSGVPNASMGAAIVVAIGIGIQNFPEGTAVSVPLRREGMSRKKSFFYGQLSGIVEPIAGVIGAFAVSSVQIILPYALAFAAGAMIFVVVEELIPEATQGGNVDLATIGVILGFALMMLLDVALS